MREELQTIKEDVLKLYKNRRLLLDKREKLRIERKTVQYLRLKQKVRKVSLEEKKLLIQVNKLTKEVKALSDRKIGKLFEISHVSVRKWINAEEIRIKLKLYKQENKRLKESRRTAKPKAQKPRNKVIKGFKDHRFDQLPLGSPYTAMPQEYNGMGQQYTYFD